jgi:hypothetical protein
MICFSSKQLGKINHSFIKVLSTGFVDCCSPSNHTRNSYEEPRFHYPSHEKSFMKTTSIDHIPESERKGVLWTGSGVHVIAGGVKKVHTEIVGNITVSWRGEIQFECNRAIN